MTYEEKWAVLASYTRLKNRMRVALLERDELRDLTKMTNEIGTPPTKGNVSDPTGNTAVKLLHSVNDLEREMKALEAEMNGVKRFINNATGISEEEKYILMLKFIRGYSNRRLCQAVNMDSKDAVRKRIYRIVNRMKPEEAGE